MACDTWGKAPQDYLLDDRHDAGLRFDLDCAVADAWNLMQAYLQERDDKGKARHTVQDLLRAGGAVDGMVLDHRGNPIRRISPGRKGSYQDPRKLAELSQGKDRTYGPE